MAKTTRGLRVWPYLHPRTATTPVTLDQYLESQARSRVIDNDILNPDWIVWYDRMSSKR